MTAFQQKKLFIIFKGGRVPKDAPSIGASLDSFGDGSGIRTSLIVCRRTAGEIP